MTCPKKSLHILVNNTTTSLHKICVNTYELTDKTKKFNSCIRWIFGNDLVTVIVHEHTHIQYGLQVHFKIFCSVVRKLVKHFANVFKIIFHSKSRLVRVVNRHNFLSRVPEGMSQYDCLPLTNRYCRSAGNRRIPSAPVNCS